MPLPHVNGWIIDYRTAEFIFESQSNLRIDHCVMGCQNGTLHICHYEEKDFRGNTILKVPFIIQQNRIFDPDEEVYDRCQEIQANPLCKRLLNGSLAPPFITAIAASKQLGVIANRSPNRFTTVHELCAAYGVPVFTADEYFAQL